jgi:hypothetical protein
MGHARFARRLLAAALATAAAGATAHAGKGLQTLSAPEDFRKLLEVLQGEAETFAQADSDQPPAAHPAVTKVQYDPAAVEPFEQALLTEHKLPLARLYLIYQLLQPLDSAGDEHLAKLRGPLLKVFALCTYRRMPTWPAHKLQKLVLPERRMSKLERQRREEEKRTFLEEKRAKERAVVRHNRTAHAIGKALKVLLIRMRQEQADEVLLARLAKEDDDRWSTYQTTLDGIRAEAVYMRQPQAKRYYDGLLKLYRQNKRKRRYDDPTNPNYSEKENSSFHSREGWFAQESAGVINLVSTSAREPAVVVPGERQPPRRPPRPRRDRRP